MICEHFSGSVDLAVFYDLIGFIAVFQPFHIIRMHIFA